MGFFFRTEAKIPILFKYGKDFIELVGKYKYLGVIFQRNEKINITKYHLANQANKVS